MLTDRSRMLLDDLREGDTYIEIVFWHHGRRVIRGVYEGLVRYRDKRWAIEIQPGDGWTRQYLLSKITTIKRMD